MQKFTWLATAAEEKSVPIIGTLHSPMSHTHFRWHPNASLVVVEFESLINKAHVAKDEDLSLFIREETVLRAHPLVTFCSDFNHTWVLCNLS